MAHWESWWLIGSAPDCPGSNPACSQPKADCQSPGGLPLFRTGEAGFLRSS